MTQTKGAIRVIDTLDEIATISLENPKMDYHGKRAGKTYRIYSFDGKGFQLPEEHPFNVAYDNAKNLAMVKLQEKTYTKKVTVIDDAGVETEEEQTREAWDLAGFLKKDEKLSNKLFDVKLKAIDKLADVDTMDATTLSTVLATTL